MLALADPEGRVTRRSQVLCAALGVLAEACQRALGGRPERDRRVALAAAMLALLTKIDDEVIDRPSFHNGGPAREPRAALERRTRAYLDPTLRSIIARRPQRDEPRCALAAQLGVLLRELACTPARLERLLETIAFGWEVQVRAVSIYSAHPAEVSPQEVATVTAEISGAWLQMITEIGTLPGDASRSLRPAEQRGFLRWGADIQRADALSDFGKDLADGLVSTVPGMRLYARLGEGYLRWARGGEEARLYAALAEHDIDRGCLPTRAGPPVGGELSGLGEVPRWLEWIRGFLTWRYLAHPLSRRGDRDPAFSPFLDARPSWVDYVSGVRRLAERSTRRPAAPSQFSQAP